MDIIIARTAGFCFGVDKAVKTIEDLVDKKEKRIYTLGPIIHNEQVVDRLNKKGVDVLDNVDNNKGRGFLVIRTHGITEELAEKLEKSDFDIIDATCPHVKKIHFLVKEKYTEEYNIVIVGDKEHPEVKGTNGWCDNKAFIVDNEEDADKVVPGEKGICVVAQTTITREKWEKINKYLNKKFENVIKFDTICNATITRQKEAEELAGKVDAMIVIGGRNSSNTRKLYDICKKKCNWTIVIETSDELPSFDVGKINKIGITAGASTPDWIIKEVIEKMDELNKQENEMSFGEVFESSIVTLQTGDIVKGKIIGFNNAEVYVDLGFKSDGIISMEEFTDDPEFKPEESLKVGEEVEVFIIRVNDGEGNVLLSKKKVDAVRNWDKIEGAVESKEPVKAKITDVVNGGVIANAGGVKIFIPASQVSDRYVKDLKEFVKQVVTLRVIEFNKQKRRIVGSVRVILEEQKAKAAVNIWDNIEVGKKYSGIVKSLTDFGAFVDIGGVDGLVHLSELSWTKIKHPSDVLKIGDKVEVVVLDADKDKKRISLGYRKTEDDPWFKAEEKFKVGEVVKGKVVRLVPFGAFVELEGGVDGLVHISNITHTRIAKPGDVLKIGQEVEAKIIEINTEAKKIALSIKELIPKEVIEEKKASASGDNTEELPTEHKEDMSVTIGDITDTGK
ncbi:MAG: bifunctional 4-hydroxy-3-methylbut-2-enyl diphosphate reductase/30S ribosomal protein S1 [Bacillota bacterium]|nr:bifunctional 4-hydroxy-3-methylbut-2-enyl diphosphate reductase/30S ribosomal protein S1 [Bacillota bacterium]